MRYTMYIALSQCIKRRHLHYFDTLMLFLHDRFYTHSMIQQNNHQGRLTMKSSNLTLFFFLVFTASIAGINLLAQTVSTTDTASRTKKTSDRQRKLYGAFTKLEVGYIGTFLYGANNSATNQIFSSRNPGTTRDTADVTGSSMLGSQNGISARFNIEFGEKNQLILPLGIEYTAFRGGQQLNVDSGARGAGTVRIDMFTVVAGIQHRLWNLPFAQAFLYGGMEARASFLSGTQFEFKVTNRDGTSNPNSSIDTLTKESTFRMGGAIRVGVQGVIQDPIRINVSYAIGFMNLFGRDMRTSGRDRRGELLTPSNINQTNEILVPFGQFNLSLQVAF